MRWYELWTKLSFDVQKSGSLGKLLEGYDKLSMKVP